MLSFCLICRKQEKLASVVFWARKCFWFSSTVEALEPSTTIFLLCFGLRMVTTTALIARVRIGILVPEMEGGIAKIVV